MAGIAASQLGLSLATIGSAQSVQAHAALTVKGKAKAAAANFESMFLQTMFQQMFTGIDGEGPFGGSGALKVWRSFLTDQYAQSFARSGGLGIASHVYDQLLAQQGASAS
ncbi:MAG TPA: rod-binding protein [Xanthobacteraceae bacterium]|nr:rod-binding protein [Xanthobacteraceae bacterium]